jgi:hypothetical protein
MFVRFRYRGTRPGYRRLNVTVAVAARDGQRVCQRHAASLGSLREDICDEMKVYQRGRTWKGLCEVLDELHPDEEATVKLMKSLQTRVPLPAESELTGAYFVGATKLGGADDIARAVRRCRALLQETSKLPEPSGS